MKKCQLDLTDEQTVHAHKHENLVLDGVGGGVWILSLHWASNGCIGLTFITTVYTATETQSSQNEITI